MDLKLKNQISQIAKLSRLTICVAAMALGFSQNAFSQAVVVDEASSSAEVRSYVEDVLLGSCVTVSNISYTGPADASGTFDGSGTILGLDGGIILTTGEGDIAEGPDDDNNAGHNQNNGGDADLTAIAGITTYDAVILEFDFIPQNDTLRFNYIFGSEEYPEYVNGGYNDAFGFFISGPGITGPYTNGAENIALIPGGTTPVTIDNVNNGYSATEPATGPCTNCAYYVDNSSGPAVQYDGHTTVLTAEAIVTPCLTYHIKLAVADAGDHVYDSGVFLEEGSFSAGGGIWVDIETTNTPPGIYEGCADAWFVFRRVDLSDNSNPVTANYTVTGTAIPGVDYSTLPPSVTIPAGEDSVLVNVNVFLDFIPEGTETITLTMLDPPCTCLAPGSATIDVLDNDIPLAVTTTGTTTICLGQSANLTANPSGSLTPYTSSWNNGAPAGNNVTVSPTTTTTYTYTVTDNCGGQTVASSETVTVIRPDFTIDDDEQCFDGNSFSFTNTGASGGSVSHFWDFGDSNTSTSESPTHSYGASGNYTVTHNVIYTASGCTATATANIIVFDEPILTSTVDQNVICVGGTDGAISTTLTGGTAPFNYIWSPGGQTSSSISGLGVGTYSVVVTDANGCTDNAAETIIQDDPTPPTAICQDITVQLNSGGVVTISATQVNNGSSDNCGIASMVVSPNAFDCNDVGANAVVLTVTDVNGNVSTCNATVTVEDNIAPTALCQNVTVQLDASGNASVTSTQINNGSSDNCAIQSMVVSPNTFDCSDVGANTVTLTVTDVNGNVSTCNATVTVQDNIAPTAVCQNITLNLDASGNGTITASQIDNGSSDNCGIQSLAVNPSAFDCADLGNNTVTLTVTDVNGNVSTCNATVNVLDNIDPTAVCQDITVQLNASGTVSIVPAQINNGSTDNCSVQSVTVSPNSFTCANVGPNTVTLTVVDGSGNTATCTATVTVEDNINPNAVCQNVTVQLDASGNASITAAQVDGGSTDNCAIQSLAVSPSTFDCSDVGANTVTLTVTDVNGNVSTCNATVTLQDNIPPTAVCQDITVQLDASGNATISALDVNNGSTDNCAIASMVVSPNAFDCSDVGGNAVTLTVTDVNGNTSTCSATVTIEDDIDPTAVCQDITVQLDASGNASITASQVDNGSSDNCAVQSISVSPSTFDCGDVGANTVTLAVTDVNGNSSTCTATVTVEDNINPTALCQNLTVQLDVSGNASILASQIDNGSSDNCAIQTITVNPSTFDCSDVGSNTVTLTVTDVNGNVSTCSATVTVEDNIAPTAICQDVTVVLNGSGDATIEASAINNGSNDNCGIASVTVVPTTFDCSDVGPNTVTLTVTDVNGNVSTCASTVTVEDNEDPTAVCQDITVQLDATGNVSIVASQIDNGSTDNCAVDNISIVPSGFTCGEVGANSVTLTVTDVNGNISTCTATVTVEDNIPPTAVCQDITIQLDASGSVNITGGMVDNGSSDNCAIASLTVLPNSFDCTNVGANTVTLTVTDVNGNVSTCTSTVTVEDNVDPTAVCQNITVQLDASGNASVTATQLDGGSTDNCGIASLSVAPNTFDCNDLGNNLVVLTVTDDNGNTSTCTATVTIVDNVPPTPICQDIIAELDATGNVIVAAGDVDNGSTDNCAIQSITLNPNTFDCDDIGLNAVTLTVTDISGNSATCTANVDVQDNVLPTAICQDISVVLDASGNATITPNMVNNGSSDACGTVTPTLVEPNTFNCSNVGVNTVTLTVEDPNGNISTCEATVTISDNIAPTAVCQDITVQLNASGNVSITPAQVDGGSSDNCAIDYMTVTPNSFTCAEEGPNTVTLLVVDVNGNSSSCTASVTVENNITPTVSCQDITVYLDASGNVSITAADVDGGSNAACGIASLDVNPSTFDCSDVGANTVTLTGTDNSGNQSTCTATVTVVDNVPPTAVCQDVTIQLDASGNASIVAADIDGGSTDNCAVASLSASQTAFDCDDVGNNTVTLTVTDVNGNSSTCTAIVTVEDDIAPSIVCQDITVVLDANGQATIVAADIDNGTTDNCDVVGGGITLTVTPTSFDCNDLGSTTATLTATDAAGNSSTCTATITVEDNEAPTALCQNITVYLDAAGNVGITPADIDNGSSDNCAIASMTVSPNSFTCSGVGVNPVSLTVTDATGNVASCSATVTVVDTISPTAICQDIVVQLNASGTASIVPSQINNGSSDICGIASITVSPNTFNCSNVGANTVTLTVTDVNGNVSTCTSTVTVQDNVNPTAVCQPITVQLDASGNATIVAADVDGGSSDNCAIASLAVSQTAFDCGDVGPNNVTLTVTDVNGNVSSCTAVVTVEDNVDPTAVCQDITVQLNASGTATITAAQVNNGSTDNCAVASLAVAPNTFSCADVGLNVVTLTVTDVNGNVSTCTSNVTVEDNVAPNALCQNITVQLDAVGNASITASQVNNGSNDNCAIASLSVSPNTFDCDDIGGNIVTLTVTDVNGNVSTCTATVTVEDNVDPVVICQDVTVELDVNGEVSITGSDIDGGTTDNCDENGLTITFSANPSDLDCNNVGTNTVVLTATDNYGNSSTCNAVVTVEDNLPPTAICQNITVQLDGTGNVSIVAADVNNGSFDNCAIDNMSVAPSAFTCANVGGNTVTLTVTDVNGNVSTCTATVTVEDNVPPVAVCQDITVELDATGNVSIVAADVNNGSSDNCAIASMTVNPSAFTCAEEGPNTVTLTVTDVNGNVSTCTSTVTVENNITPTVSCQDITVYLDGSGNTTITASDVDGGSNAACGIASLVVSPSSFNCSNVGPNTVTLTGTDNSGNTSTCTATVTVLDTVSPTANCQDITIQLDNSGNASIVAADVNNGSSDNCAIDNMAVSPSTFDCSNVGANTVTLTVTDVNGNVSTCTATVTVEDNVAPIAVCQDIPVELDATGNVSITASQVDGGSSDNCAIASMSVSPSAFTCAEVGGNTVTLTVTDVNGNVSTCTATVTVMDNESPTALCQDITVQLDASGNVSITPADVDNGSSDNCAIDNMTVAPNTFTCAGVGANPVTLTVTDVNGNISTCSATVTVEDNVPPAAVCQNITVQLDGSGNALIVPTQVDNGSSDACGIASLAVSPNTFDCSNVGANTVTLTVTDVNGNASTCTSTVTVEDNVNPTAVCQDITVQLNAAGAATITAAQVDGGSSDNCAVASISVSPNSFNCSNVGGNVVTLTVTDVNGNVSTCTANVTVEDNVPPTALCQDITVQLDATGNASITAAQVDGGSTDNCAIDNLSVSPSTFSCADVGGNTVTLTVTDVNGNSSTCTAIVTVQDNVDPIAVCQDITVQLNGVGTASITASQVNNGSSDNCAIASMSVSPNTFDCDDIGANTVTLTVTDVNGNVSTCTSTVTVEDNIDPVIICQDITVQLDASGTITITGADIDNGTADNCSTVGSGLTLTATPGSFDCNNVGANTVTLTATDAYGNSSTCTATVTVEDNIDPTAICQNITVQLDATGNVSITPGDVDNGSFDNCGIANMTLSQDAFDCSNVGGNTVTLTVTDDNGNSSTCTATVTVQDTVSPTAVCQDITVQLDATGNVTITAGQVNNSSSDNCAIASMTVTPNSFTCAHEGDNTVTLTVTDVNGNVSTCTSTVTVENNVVPNVSCQDITVYLDGTGNVSIIADDVNGGSNASCGLASLTVTPDAFDCSNVGPNTVTLTAVDNSGNSSSCTATVTVLDTVSPTAVCQNITIQLDNAGNASIVAAQVDGGSTDNCVIDNISVSQTAFDCSHVGPNTVTLTVTDVNGNVSTCDAVVTVQDNVNPIAICQDIPVELDVTGNVSITASQIDNGSSDNCGIASMTVSPSSFDCSNVGGNVVTLTVTDVNGNVSACTSTVTVMDNEAPNALCQDITVQLNAAGNASITAAQIDNGSTDNCAILSMSVTPNTFTCAGVGANPVTLTVTDVNGNVSTCSATVTVEDNVPPVAVCQDITVQLNASGTASIVPIQINNGSSDACGIASLDVSPNTFDCSNVGSNTVTLTVTDVNGNVSTCTSTVTVEDNVNPIAVCQDITIQLDASGNTIIIAADVDGGSTDNCAIDNLSVTPSAFTCANVGGNLVTLTVTDVNGNTSTCTADVTVQDNVPPVAVCQDITVQLNAAGTVSIAAADVDGGSSDNCAIASLAVAPSNFNCSNVGANTVTLTVTDVNGNVSTCTSMVTVEDNVNPTAICQDITVQLDAAGNASIVAAQVDGGSTDNCAIASLSVDPSTFDCSNIGANTVTLTVTDVNGNVSTCTANVTVEDNVDPVVICQDITVELDANGEVNITGADLDGGTTDNCDQNGLNITFDVTPEDFDCNNVGSNTVTLTATDAYGNSSSCTAIVTVEDNVDPTAVCQDITIQLDATGSASIVAADVDGGSFDNCAIDNLAVSQEDFDCSHVGANTVTLTVTDVNGNVSTCTATVTVEDNVAPIAVCQDITIQLDANGEASIVAADVDGGSSDNCAIASLDVSPSSFTCAEEGANTVTLTVTDVNGNVSTCTATVTVENNIAPNVFCQDITVYLDATGNVGIIADDVNGGSNASCGLASLTVTPDAFDCSNVGTNTVTLTAVDNSGNTSSCTAVVTVLDTIDPTAVCQDITVFLDANGDVVINSADIDGGSSDNCGVASVNVENGQTSTSFDCSDVGSNTVTLTVTDVNGNISTCDAIVTVVDTVSPTAVCQDITVQLSSSGVVTINSVDIDGGSNDNCGIASITVDGGNTNMSFDCSNVGTNTVTLTVTDVNGNVSTCDAMVTVEDTISPTAICQNITVQLDANGDVSINSIDIDGGSFDNCGIASWTIDGGNTTMDFDCSQVGANTITLTVTDVNGNVSTCDATVTVVDTIAPTAICQDITVQLDANGNVVINSVDIDGGSFDNCGIASITVDQGQLNTDFDCSSVGTNTVTLTVTDVNGNVSTCDAQVTVEDNINPTANCQDIVVQLDANGEVFLTPVDIDNGSFDNCSIDSLTIVPDYFDCTNFGTNSVVLTVYDNNGNASTCISTITVDDTIPPTAVCQDITVQLNNAGTATIAPGDVDNGSFDNCDIASLAIDVNAFDCSDVGPNTVTLTVTDVNGNVSTCTSTATVVDQVDPLLACQNITVYLDPTGNVSITAQDVDNGSTDACGIDTMYVDQTDFDCSNVGVNQVTLWVADVNQNFDICQATVTVVDTVPPTAVCQDITIQLDATGSASIAAADVDGGSFDNCGVDAISVDQTIFDCSQVGPNTVTLTVVDVNGNESTCEAIVTVEDNIVPNANCQDITVYLDANGEASILASDINAGSNANCGVDTVFVNPNTFTCAEVGNNTVTLTVVDNNGNTSTCTANVEVLDTISPIALCQDITVQLNGNGQTSIVAADVDNGSFDNCGVASIAIDQTAFDCSLVGPNTVTLTVTDVNGNVSTCTSTVTVEDTVPPVASCSAFVVQLDASGLATITPEDIDNNSSDNCAVASLSLDQSSFDCSEVGTNTVELTVTDVNGNSSTCTATVIVEDNVPPVTACQDITIYLDAAGQVAIVPADVDAGSTDNCAIDTMYVTPSDFTCSGVGANPVTLTVTDVNGNTSSCVATVTVLDTISPIAICQDITVQLDANGEASIDPEEIDNGSNDACGVLQYTVDINTFDCSMVGGNTVVLTVEDNNGNTSTCSATVTIEDNVNPIAVCQDLTIILDGNGTVNVSAGEVDGGSTDNCGIDAMFIAQNDFTCADLGSNIINLTVVDVNGNSDVCAAEITVLDTLSPVIIGCPMDTVIVPDSSDCTPQVFWTEPTTEDNCTATLTSDFVPGDNFPVGTTTVTYASTDQSGNIVTCSFDITIQPSPVVVAITAQEGPCGYNLSCNGAADGEATANVSGGCLPYDYLWSDPLAQTTQTATGLDAGSYAVTVTDENGTTVTETVIITEPDVLATDSITSPEFVGGANISCNGEFDGSININIIGGSECVTYDFAWTGPNGFTSTDEDLTGLEAGTYVVTVTDASGCSYMDSIALTEPDALDADSLVSDYNGVNISCGGASDGWIDLTVSGGATPYTYVWSNGETTEDIDSLMAGIYTYTITDANGCEISGSITLTEPDGLSSNMTLSDYNGFNISCFGLSDGSIDLTVSDGTAPYSYQWSTSSTDEDLTDLPAGTYTVVITDANGCTHTDSVSLTEPTELVLALIDTTLISCNGELDGSFTVEATGGVPAYDYAWSNGQAGPVAQNIGAGLYMVTVTDLNGCQDSIPLLMTEPDVLEASVVQVIDVTCYGESNGLADINVVGGTAPYSYDWSNNGTDQDLNGVPAGTYDLEVTDANGCTDTLSVTITEPEELTMTVDTVIDATCSGATDGEITVEAEGGTLPYVYTWASIGQSGPTATNLSAGVYQVEVVDANGCSWTLTASVGQPSSIEAEVIVQAEVSCNGFTDGSAIVTPSGGTEPYGYLWSNNVTDSISTGLGAGNHWVVITDAAGCDTTLNFEIVEPELIVLDWDTILNVTCNGYTNGQLEVNVEGGTLPYNISWSNGDQGPVSTNLEAGLHTVYITDGNGCMDSLSTFVSEPDTIELIQHSTSMVTCFGGNDGEATILVNGGTPPFTYDWPAIGQTGPTATALYAGWYTFIATDANGCTYTDSIQITEPNGVIAIASADTAICPGGSVTISVTASGGTGNYSYVWDNGLGAGMSHVVSPSQTTTYVVEVIDQTGCPGLTDSVTVTIAETPVAAFSSDSDAPCMLPTTINFTNMSSNATGFEWNFGNGDVSNEENPTAVYDEAGTYTVTLVAYSAAGCIDSITGTVVVDTVPSADFTLENVEGCAPVLVNFGNGSSNGFEYFWDFGDGNTSTLSDPTHLYEIPGDYAVTLIVSSANGCTDTLELEAAVSVYPSPIADFTPVSTTFPEPGGTYEFVNNTIGGDLYNWDFGNGDQTDEFQPTYDYFSYGGYYVTLTAINEFGCADTAVHYITVDLQKGLFVPNAMAIGHNGEAGFFTPTGVGLAEYHVWVFDNWGALLWESNALENGSPTASWDGTYKGQYVPQGSYVWKINAVFEDGEVWDGMEMSNGKKRNTGTIMVIF